MKGRTRVFKKKSEEGEKEWKGVRRWKKVRERKKEWRYILFLSYLKVFAVK
jgi:hypothetical protein